MDTARTILILASVKKVGQVICVINLFASKSYLQVLVLTYINNTLFYYNSKLKISVYRGRCLHGICVEDGSGSNFCACYPGWRGLNCEKCQPYWACPNQEADACNFPNECLCDSSIHHPLCNNDALLNAKTMGKIYMN